MVDDTVQPSRDLEDGAISNVVVVDEEEVRWTVPCDCVVEQLLVLG